MLGHLGINVPDLRAARAYYDRLMPLLGFMVRTRSAVRAAHAEAVALGSQVLHPPRIFPQYPQPYYASFWLDPFGFMVEAVCHHDRDWTAARIAAAMAAESWSGPQPSTITRSPGMLSAVPAGGRTTVEPGGAGDLAEILATDQIRLVLHPETVSRYTY